MALDKRHPMNTDMNDIDVNNSQDLIPAELEALQDKLGTGKTAE